LDGEVSGRSSWKRSRQNVGDKVVRAEDYREVKRILLEEEMPADYFCGFGVANKDQIPVVSVNNEMSTLEKVV
jgi:hypothetical protein